MIGDKMAKCVVCGKEFLSVHNKQVCSDACRRIRNANTRRKNYIESVNKFNPDANAAVYNGNRIRSGSEAKAFREYIKSTLDKKPRENCMFCSKVNSKECGNAIFDGSLTGGRYIKVPDGRCNEQR